MNNVSRIAPLTISEAIVTVLPEGTAPFVGGPGTSDYAETETATEDFSDHKVWQSPPVTPFDLFAVCGYIITQSGLMGHFEPDPEGPKTFAKDKLLKVCITDSERRQCEQLGKKWLEEAPLVPAEIDEYWTTVVQAWNLPIRCAVYQAAHRASETGGSCPSWWNAIMKLFIIADEASAKVGYIVSDDPDLPLVHRNAMVDLREARMNDVEVDNEDKEPVQTKVETPGDRKENAEALKKADVRSQAPKTENKDAKKTDSKKNKADEFERKFLVAGQPPGSYAKAAHKEVVCVQPKGRVSQLGHSLRNLSKNLALTGPVGGVRCKWHQLQTTPKVDEDDGLDIVLVPIPYELPARLFSPKGNHKSAKDSNGKNPGWGNFEIKQEWLTAEHKQELVATVVELVKEAKKDVESVNAIVFPEYSLSYEVFKEVCSAIVEVEDKIEFVIAGSSKNCDGEDCNCVFTAIWEKSVGKDPKTKGEPMFTRLTSQKKHHRWRLEKNQLSTYGLAGRLQPDKHWWEDHTIGQRELNFFQFRKSSAFASLICEDLARNDPVHDVLRSVGPNLLFALLMDGAQRPFRWSARYASTLADDPGTSVLTVTSYGLLKRANENSGGDQSHAIGFWKDDSGAWREVTLPPNAKGVLLSLSAFKAADFTIDGRCCDDSRSWRFNSQKPLYLD